MLFFRQVISLLSVGCCPCEFAVRLALLFSQEVRGMGESGAAKGIMRIVTVKTGVDG
jgi:hypothetical protein